MTQAIPSATPSTRPSVGDSAATPAPLIEIHGVSAGYENTRQKTRLIALRDVELDVYRGEFLAIVGPSGCGKTTLINMIAGFMKPLEGTIRVDGQVVHGPGPDRTMVFQDYAVLPWRTVYNNVKFALENRHPRPSKAVMRERIGHALELVGLTGVEKSYPYELSGRNASKGRHRTSAGVGPRDLVDGRTLRGGRCHDARGHAGRVREDHRRDRSDRLLHNQSANDSHDKEKCMRESKRLLPLRPTPAEMDQ